MTLRDLVIALTAALIIGLAAVLSGASWSIASADDGMSATVRLEPGLNYVAWISEPTDVASLFDEVPQAELVYAWDAVIGRYRLAASNGFGDLRTLEPGAGLIVRIGGEHGVDWRRPGLHLRPIIQLEQGWNFVAWSGVDGTSLNAAVNSIRSSVSRALSPVGERRLELGDPIWVEAREPVRWVQDPGVIPQMLFPGGVSDQIRELATEDVIKSVEFFVERFGLFVPGMTFYFPLSCEALNAAALPQHAEVIRATCGSVTHFAASAWAGPDYVVAHRSEAVEWYDLSLPPGASNLDNLELFTHEYAHSLQYQLAETDDLRAPNWIVEGMAEWLGFWQRIDARRSGEPLWGIRGSASEQPAWNAERGLIGEPIWDDERSGWRRELFDSRTPALRSAEQRGGSGIAYELGIEAVELLVQRAGPELLFAFWRALVPTMIGPDSSWRSRLDWRAAFQETFGFSVESFYEDFEAWREAQTEGREFTRLGFEVVQGRLLDARGEPVVNAKVQFVPEQGWGTRGQFAHTDPEGRFTTIASHDDHDYRIEITLENGCQAWFGQGGWTSAYDQAEPLTVAMIPLDPERVSGWLPGEEYWFLGIDGQREIVLQMPDSQCETTTRRIRGVLRLSEREPLPGIAVRWRTSERHGQVRTDLEGAFELTGKDGDRFRIFVDLSDECILTYESWGYVQALYIDEATDLRVDGGDVELTAFNIPPDACR